MKKSHFILLWSVLIMVVLPLILVQADPAWSFFIDTKSSLYMNKSIVLKGTKYIPLILICQSHEIDWGWDPVIRRVRISKNNRQVVLSPGQKKILVEERAEEFNRPVMIHKGSIVIPANELKKLLKFLEPGVPGTNRFTSSLGLYSMKRVVIDPGHGGKDPGAIGRTGLKEKNVVLDISLKLKKMLQTKGIQVIMTRTDDTFIPLRKRAQIANDYKADFFISIHANSARHRGADGFEVFYLSEAIDDNARAVAAAENEALKFEDNSEALLTDISAAIVWDIINTENRLESVELADTLCSAVEDRQLLKNRGVKSANFCVLRGTRMPAVLVEVGFLSNSGEESRLADKNYRYRIAETLASGVIKYKKLYDRSNGFTCR
ncbi:MAG: N-acetylmuramoyl-L-alanine amidase [Candidatus Omnitrophica bacterium]|nr:N-acetylmuramoyl-L-alanine amidase [Candidatus Omnitrophota bacterium]